MSTTASQTPLLGQKLGHKLLYEGGKKKKRGGGGKGGKRRGEEKKADNCNVFPLNFCQTKVLQNLVYYGISIFFMIDHYLFWYNYSVVRMV